MALCGQTVIFDDFPASLGLFVNGSGFLVFFLAMRWVMAQFDGLCAEIRPFKNYRPDLRLFWALLAALVVLLVFLVPCSS